MQSYLPLLRQGERIETRVIGTSDYNFDEDLPLLRQGERIETHLLKLWIIGEIQISPCLGKGSGLKHAQGDDVLRVRQTDLPLLRQGERIETRRHWASG